MCNQLQHASMMVAPQALRCLPHTPMYIESFLIGCNCLLQMPATQPQKAPASRTRAGRRKRTSSQLQGTAFPFSNEPASSPSWAAAADCTQEHQPRSTLANAQQLGKEWATPEAYLSPASTVPAEHLRTPSSSQPGRANGQASPTFSLHAATSDHVAEQASAFHAFQNPGWTPPSNSFHAASRVPLAGSATPLSTSLQLEFSSADMPVLTGRVSAGCHVTPEPCSLWHGTLDGPGSSSRADPWPWDAAEPRSRSIPGEAPIFHCY